MLSSDDPDHLARAEAIADGEPVCPPTPTTAPAGAGAAAESRDVWRAIEAIAAANRHAQARDVSVSLGEILAAAPATQASTPAAFTERWGPLLVGEPVGRGSFGTVYRAWYPRLDKEVALKRFRLPVGTPRSEIDAVVREAQLLARVRHENVITVHGADEVGGEVGIWMDFVRGRTLADIVTDDGAMSAGEALVVAESLCRALAAVHGAHLLHRDIKAANVMRESGGRIVMLDFGAGIELAPDADAAGRVGTPFYMAPELFEGARASKRSDIYSLGVLLFYLVTRTYPVYGTTEEEIGAAHRAGRRRFLLDLRADLPRDFVQVVERALSPDPEQRYPSAGAMLHALAERRLDPIRRLVLLSVAALLIGTVGFWLIGWLTTLTFNATVGRVGEFGNEGLFDLWRFGQRALIPPLFVLIVASLLLLAARPVCRVVLAAPFGLARRIDWIDAACRSTGTAVRSDVNAVAQVVLVAQVAIAAALWWRFVAIFSAITQRLSDAPYEAVAPLGPAPGMSDERGLFVVSVSVAMLLMVMTWVTLLRRSVRTGAPISPATTAGGVTLTAILLLLLVMPWRVMYANKHERVTYESERCYVVADRRPNVMLYCPDVMPPKTRIVRADDEHLRRSHILESIFSPPATGRAAAKD